ncbi:MAG: DALR anticodon-binding domain-containing protein [Gloeotrichia echinulata DVL01]|jgi:arginyl-tRNA synthetase
MLSCISIHTQQTKIIRIKATKSPLYKGRDHSKIIYISGVALQLSKSQNPEAMDLAQAIASQLLAVCGDVFHIQIVPPGWIHLELTHPVLAAWLQNLALGGLGERGNGERSQEIAIQKTKSQIHNSYSLFPIQYAHARCCSLLRLADREGLIQLRESGQQRPLEGSLIGVRSLISPDPIPWLNSEEKLRLNDPAEGDLIFSLVQVVDDLECDSVGDGVKWEKIALDLSQTFEAFYCKCRIWGEVKITSQELAQARLGLVMATQSVFRFLLEEKLGVIAPLEL